MVPGTAGADAEAAVAFLLPRRNLLWFDMDRAMILDHLARAQRHVDEGVKLIDRQRQLIEKLRSDGHAETASLAAELLARFEEMQKLHIADRDRLMKELDDYSD